MPGVATSVDTAMAEAVALGCFLHSSGLSPITAGRRKEVEATGLAYVDVPPADIAADVATHLPPSWREPRFAKVTWPVGSAWVIGFADGRCLIDVTGNDGPALLAATHMQFGAGPWQKLPPQAAPERYGAAVQPPGKAAIAIVANVVGIDLPSGGRREVITFETTPNK